MGNSLVICSADIFLATFTKVAIAPSKLDLRLGILLYLVTGTIFFLLTWKREEEGNKQRSGKFKI